MSWGASIWVMFSLYSLGIQDVGELTPQFWELLSNDAFEDCFYTVVFFWLTETPNVPIKFISSVYCYLFTYFYFFHIWFTYLKSLFHLLLFYVDVIQLILQLTDSVSSNSTDEFLQLIFHFVYQVIQIYYFYLNFAHLCSHIFLSIIVCLFI